MPLYLIHKFYHERTLYKFLVLVLIVSGHVILQVQQLLNEGINLNRCIKYKDGDWLRSYTPLCIAIAHGSIQLVQLFITSGEKSRIKIVALITCYVFVCFIILSQYNIFCTIYVS